MKIQQKKFSNKHTFTFENETFNFAYEDKSGAGDVDMPYAEFPQKSSIRIEQNEWLRNVGYLWSALGLFQVGLALLDGKSLSGTGFWLVIGALCLAWFYFSKVKYSVFNAERGSVFVIQDGKTHDKIIDEINSRRKAQLLRWHGEIDLANDIENEVKKFKWLYEQKVLSKDESDLKISQVELAHKVADEPSAMQLN